MKLHLGPERNNYVILSAGALIIVHLLHIVYKEQVLPKLEVVLYEPPFNATHNKSIEREWRYIFKVFSQVYLSWNR